MKITCKICGKNPENDPDYHLSGYCKKDIKITTNYDKYNCKDCGHEHYTRTKMLEKNREITEEVFHEGECPNIFCDCKQFRKRDKK